MFERCVLTRDEVGIVGCVPELRFGVLVGGAYRQAVSLICELILPMPQSIRTARGGDQSVIALWVAGSLEMGEGCRGKNAVEFVGSTRLSPGEICVAFVPSPVKIPIQSTLAPVDRIDQYWAVIAGSSLGLFCLVLMGYAVGIFSTSGGLVWIP